MAMSLSVSSTNQTTPVPITGGTALAGQGNVTAFANSLASAVANVQQQVTQAQAQWQQQATQFDVSSLGNAVSGLTALLGQFNQALQQLSGCTTCQCSGGSSRAGGTTGSSGHHNGSGYRHPLPTWPPPQTSRLQARPATPSCGCALR
jgi:hypothetical protein